MERNLTGKLGFELERWRGIEELLVDLAAEMIPARVITPQTLLAELRG